MRPIGGIFFGQLGDRLGRKKTLVYAVSCMGVSVLITASLPTYEQLGPTASALLLLARMLQGFSVGGEHTGVLVMLIEQANQKYRGFYTSIATFISGNGVLLSSLVAMYLVTHLSDQQMLSYGWRIPYVIGCVLTLIALLLQRNMLESPFYKALEKKKKLEKHPMRQAIKDHPMAIFIVFSLTGYLGIAYYLASAFLPSYLTNVLSIDKSTAMYINSITAFTYAYSAPFFGLLSDFIGRKRLLIISITGLTLLSYPLFLMMASGQFSLLLTAEIILILLVTAATPAFITSINELFPTSHRYSGVSLGYNTGNALFGGTTPLILTELLYLTGNHLAPGFYLSGTSIIMLLIIIFKMPETYKVDLSLNK